MFYWRVWYYYIKKWKFSFSISFSKHIIKMVIKELSSCHKLKFSYSRLGFPRNGLIFCTKFALFSGKIFFCKLLCNFCAWNAMSFAWFCSIFFAQFVQNRKYILRKLRMKQNFSFAPFAQNRKFYANVTFQANCQKIDILSLELNNWRCIPYIKKNVNIWVW